MWDLLTLGVDGALVPAGTEEFSYELFESILKRLGDAYNWIEEESRGRDPLVPSEEPGYSSRLRYWATLMSYWVKGDPLVLVIQRTIAYYAKRGIITYRDFSESPYPIDEIFSSSNPKHINIIIENMMKDLETGLRYKIISYLENYHDLSVEALGMQAAGMNIAKFVEYGSSDPQVINLQEVGFSRAIALDLLEEHSDRLTFTADGELDAVDVNALLETPGLDSDIREEVENVLRKSAPPLMAP